MWQGDGRLVPCTMAAAAAAAATRARGEGLSSAAMRGLGELAPPRLGKGIRRGESGASTAGGTSPSVRLPPPPPTRMLRRSKHEMTAVAGRRADASHRTNERSLSPPTAARFLSWRICWGWVPHQVACDLLGFTRLIPSPLNDSILASLGGRRSR